MADKGVDKTLGDIQLADGVAIFIGAGHGQFDGPLSVEVDLVSAGFGGAQIAKYFGKQFRLKQPMGFWGELDPPLLRFEKALFFGQSFDKILDLLFHLA